MKDYENVTKAFTEWLDKEKKEYFIVVRDIDGSGTNLCSINGDIETLTVTLSSGMLDYEAVEQLLTHAVMMTAVKRYANEHNLNVEDLLGGDDNDV